MRARLRALLLARAPRLALRLLEPDRGELGRLGEALAARALRRAGWRLLGRRVRTPCAEVDLVVRGGATLVCVEVKTGRLPGDGPARWRPGQRLDARTLARQRGAGRWLGARLGLAGGRVDLIEVELTGQPPRPRLRHHTDLVRPL